MSVFIATSTTFVESNTRDASKLLPGVVKTWAQPMVTPLGENANRLKPLVLTFRNLRDASGETHRSEREPDLGGIWRVRR